MSWKTKNELILIVKSMKKRDFTKDTLFKATFCSALIWMLGGLASCNSDLEPRNDQGASSIVLELTEKIESDNTFAFDLFKTTYQSTNEANVFVSPLSVNMALSMTLNGAAGLTMEEMKEALRATNYSLDDINKYNKSLREALMKVDPTTDVAIANSIWYRNTLTVKTNFLSVNKNFYDAETKALDFNSPNSIQQINKWVSDKTHAKIPEIVKEISPMTMMYLINATYFNGIWKSTFGKDDTREEYFYPENDVDRHQAYMMRQTGFFPYSEDEQCRYLKLDYGNGAFSMIVMLPQYEKTLDDVIANLNSATWRDAMHMGSYEVSLRFPRFKVECEYEMSTSILPSMGMKNPFTEDADFSGISDVALCISKVIHKTFVDVNEDGTEAAAVTAVEMDATALPPGQIVYYVVNRPFAFAICENSTGVILFIGTIGDVSQ